MSCEQYREQFTDLLEGTLPEQDWRRLEAHLQRCESCALAIKDFRRTVSALRSLVLVEPPRGLARTITARIAQETTVTVVAAPVVKAQPARRRAFPWSAAGALAAACLVVAVVAVYNLRPTSRPAGPIVAAPAPVASDVAAAVPPAEASAPAETAAPAPAQAAPVAGPRSVAGEGARPPRPAASGPRTGSRSAAAGGSRTAAQVESEAPPAGPGSPAGPAGPVGPAVPRELGAPPAPAPTASALSAGADPAIKSTAPGVAVSFGGPQAMAAEGGGAGARSVAPEPVSLDLKVDPPGARRVGDWGPLSITLTANRDVPQVSVSVEGGSALQVRGGQEVYSGPLQGRTPKRLSAQIRATEAGSHSVRVVLSSATAGASTAVRVQLRGYEAEPGTTRRSFRSVPLGEAARAVAADCGLSVQVDPALSGQRITADFSGGVSGVSALRSLASMVGGKLVSSGGGYRLAPTD